MIELSTYIFEVLRKDEEFILYRGRSANEASQLLVLSPVAEHPALESLKQLEHEYSLKEELDSAWAVRPLAKVRHLDRTVLVSEDPGGVPLDQLLSQPFDLAPSLRLAIGLSIAILRMHRRKIIHKDIKPANVLVNSVTGQCWLRGIGSLRGFHAIANLPNLRSLSPGHSPTWHPSRPAHESFDRFAERSLLIRGFSLRDADREASLHGFRSIEWCTATSQGSLYRPKSGGKMSRLRSRQSS